MTFALSSAESDAGRRDTAPRVPAACVRPAPRADGAERWAVKLDFVGAKPGVRPGGTSRPRPSSATSRGRASSGGRRLKTYRGVVYPELWPGIDLVYTGTAAG